jgi:hypothetical protein
VVSCAIAGMMQGMKICKAEANDANHCEQGRREIIPEFNISTW